MQLHPFFKLFTLTSLAILFVSCQPSPNSSRDSLRKSDLVGGKWKLTKLTADSTKIAFDPDMAPLLEFRDDLIGGNSGCNTYRVGWQLGQDGKMSLTGPMSQSRKACLESIMATERHFIDILSEGHTIVLSEGTLVISSHKGELVFADAK